MCCFPSGRVVKVVFLNKKNEGIVLQYNQHKQHNPTTLRVQQHSTRSKEKNIEHNPMPLGCVVFLAEELLRLFF